MSGNTDLSCGLCDEFVKWKSWLQYVSAVTSSSQFDAWFMKLFTIPKITSRHAVFVRRVAPYFHYTNIIYAIHCVLFIRETPSSFFLCFTNSLHKAVVVLDTSYFWESLVTCTLSGYCRSWSCVALCSDLFYKCIINYYCLYSGQWHHRIQDYKTPSTTWERKK